MTIPEQMQTAVEELVSKYGIKYRISSLELKELIHIRFGTNYSSIIPPDYCYNRVNKGIVFSRYPRLLAYVERGVYECLGKNYPYDGKVYTQPKGTQEELAVGAWKNGVFIPNTDWESCCLK